MSETQPTCEPMHRLDRIERDVLYLLTGQNGDMLPWSLDDLGREVESYEDAKIAVAGLQRAGLLHRTAEDFVFASRAAVRAIEFTGHVA